jgi:hypothetical protein
MFCVHLYDRFARKFKNPSVLIERGYRTSSEAWYGKFLVTRLIRSQNGCGTRSTISSFAASQYTFLPEK